MYLLRIMLLIKYNNKYVLEMFNTLYNSNSIVGIVVESKIEFLFRSHEPLSVYSYCRTKEHKNKRASQMKF